MVELRAELTVELKVELMFESNIELKAEPVAELKADLQGVWRCPWRDRPARRRCSEGASDSYKRRYFSAMGTLPTLTRGGRRESGPVWRPLSSWRGYRRLRLWYGKAGAEHGALVEAIGRMAAPVRWRSWVSGARRNQRRRGSGVAVSRRCARQRPTAQRPRVPRAVARGARGA